MNLVCLEDVITLLDARMEAWKCPPQGWYKINTDAAFKGGKAAAAWVLRNNSGAIQYMETKLIDCETAMKAEVLVVSLASDCVEAKGWKNIVWSFDSETTVKEINSLGDLEGWRTRLKILQIKARFATFNRKIGWNHRSSNSLSDMVAKDSQNLAIVYLFNASNFDLIPPAYLDIAFADCGGGL